MTMTAGPGLRFFAEAVVTCSTTVVDADGNEVEHRGQSTATTTQFYLPPQLTGFMTMRAGFCGVRVPTSKVDTWMQAGQYAELAYYLRYSGAALLKPGVPELRQIKLFARGAGVRVKARAGPRHAEGAGRDRDVDDSPPWRHPPGLGHDRREADQHAPREGLPKRC